MDCSSLSEYPPAPVSSPSCSTGESLPWPTDQILPLPSPLFSDFVVYGFFSHTFFFFFHSSLLCSIFYHFLNLFSQRCHPFGCFDQQWGHWIQLEPGVSDNGQSWPLLTEITPAAHPVAKTLSCKLSIYHSSPL